MENKKNYLQTITLPELTNWSVRYLLEFSFDYNEDFQLVPIGQFLTRNRNIIDLDDNTMYQRVTVRAKNKGVKQRDVEQGKNIGTKRQYLVSTGQFIISKIDARNGAMGLIPESLDGAIVTNDFPTFEVDTDKINSTFLLLLTTTNTFINFAQSCSSGTTNRQRIDINQFLNINIPLPTLQEQNRIVENYNEKIQIGKDEEKSASLLQKKLGDYFYEVLGVKRIDDKVQKKGLHTVNLSLIDKWGLDFIETSSNVGNKFLSVQINQICNISSGGTPSRSRKEYYTNGKIPWIKTGELDNKIIFDTEEKITSEGLENSSAKLYDVESLIVAMYGATIGKTAKLGVKASTNQACAVLFNIDNKRILTDFLWEYLQFQVDNFKRLAYGSAQPNLNAGIISDYRIPLPPLRVQKSIVEEIQTLKEEMDRFKNSSVVNKKDAKKQFEQEIFKN